ncbi:CGI-141-RELATED/LIPASE CONTAINING PROTEIN [Ceraceosorus bombacis]|uniref:CGI-141-RELATED/LIPASE CONTAINING PROTEIN n=1 Tax=Ceraceosorus bombacis TaxID=401625 RepID=A0A0N7L9G7_9BASI|nr:CGI-141-RELATED/LIPASE CONTAINING PROTEIN [Ceraceosorus bombacis]
MRLKTVSSVTFALTCLFGASSALPADPTLDVRAAPQAGLPQDVPDTKTAFDEVSDPIPFDKQKLFSTEPPRPIGQALRQRLTFGANLAATVYCARVQNQREFNCGAPCEQSDPDGQVLFVQGDGYSDPHQSVNWLPNEKAVSVVVQGANLEDLRGLFNVLAFVPLPPANPIRNTLYTFGSNATDPIASIISILQNDISTVHGGFLATWARSYDKTLAATKTALGAHPEATKIIVAGHSLGSAIGLLTLLAFLSDIGTDLPYEYLGYGSPRVFSPLGADLVNNVVSNPSARTTYHHVHHNNDPVPHLGPIALNFLHAQNEVFLPDTDSPTALFCPGVENINCSLGRTNFTVNDHAGPYFGRIIGRDGVDCAGGGGV